MTLCCVVAIRGSQTTPTDLRSTRSGVYTAEQAARGETTFARNCTGCHTTGAYATPAFVKKWNGRPLGALYSIIADTMPEDFPGVLSPAEYAELVAYLLKINRVPAGSEELPSDLAALNKIRFDASDD
ncbi:MAG TPA: cytochrome c [Vicinamibacterales bacterium]|nr:cytochrome c [Vicinamibacterales bacterium]